jgi:hypothetical protein
MKGLLNLDVTSIEVIELELVMFKLVRVKLVYAFAGVLEVKLL